MYLAVVEYISHFATQPVSPPQLTRRTHTCTHKEPHDLLAVVTRSHEPVFDTQRETRHSGVRGNLLHTVYATMSCIQSVFLCSCAAGTHHNFVLYVKVSFSFLFAKPVAYNVRHSYPRLARIAIQWQCFAQRGVLPSTHRFQIYGSSPLVTTTVALLCTDVLTLGRGRVNE